LLGGDWLTLRPCWRRLKMLMSLLLLALAASAPAFHQGIAAPCIGSNLAARRAALSQIAAVADDDRELLLGTQAALDSIWALACTQEGQRRALAARETRESTHAMLWGKREWEQHTRPSRYLYVVLLWPYSKLAHALAPRVVALAAWSLLVWHLRLRLTATALGYLASPLALLLAFRVNSVVARLHEARGLWGQMTFTARNLASMLSAADTDEVPLATRALCCRLLVCYAWCAKTSVRFNDEDTAPLLAALLPPDLARQVSGARKPPLALLSLLRRATQRLPIEGTHVTRGVHEAIGELNRLYGAMERLLSTPLSPTYMRHTQRGMLLWLYLMPASLLSAGCTSALKLVLVMSVVGYVMFGIDEIGMQIEQPFDVLPLHSLAAGLTRDVADEILQPPHTPSLSDALYSQPS